MKKTWISLLSMSLLLVLLASSALAGSPNQGDVGGQMAAEIAERLQNHQNNTGGLPEGTAGNGFGPQGGTGGPVGGVVNQIPEGAVIIGQNGEGRLVDGSGQPVTEGDLSQGNWLNNNAPGSENQVVTEPEYLTENNTEQTTASGGTQALDWFSGGQELLKQYPSLKIYDVNSGISWSATYINGANHADVIPASADDAAKLTANNITGSYVRRPVIVTVNGVKYAGSMYAVGHGDTQYCTYFSGVMCIHFTGSMTHGSKNVDKDHQAAIQEALKSGY